MSVEVCINKASTGIIYVVCGVISLKKIVRMRITRVFSSDTNN